MRKLLLLSAGLLALAMSTPAQAQVQVRLKMGFPAVLPPLVQVEPGVRVVQDFDEEVFFVRGYYWVEREGNWYRARDHRGSWRQVGPRGLPRELVRHEPGRYRRWQHDEQRAWPTAARTRHDARHWRQSDYRPARPMDRPQQRDQEHRGSGRDGERDRH